MGYKIKIEEIIGKTFGELTVISNAGTEQLNGVNTKRIVNCRVVCWWYNLSKSIWSDSLVSGIINQWIENKGEFWQISLNTHLVQNVDQEII